MPSTRTLDIDVHRISGVVVVDILDLDVVVTVKVYLILFYCVFFSLFSEKNHTWDKHTMLGRWGWGPKKKKFDPPGPATPLMASLVPRFA